MPDLTIERLHKIATTNVDRAVKAKWLHWWNASNAVRKSVKFPEDRPMKDRVLDAWLHTASLWAQVSRDQVELLIIVLGVNFINSNIYSPIFVVGAKT